ncbi:hypothetical protein [Leclercia sp. UBA5958]|uniref:hypothetical protein n=1 Tax=Leclercia sp. UBA5958 TaxID=1946742 RepID=UPI00257E3335|nr:hypothetical protein [Leclercia sp. UBA5958]
MNFTTQDTPGSLFQQAVWQGIARVGYGETSHYQALALPAKRGCLPMRKSTAERHISFSSV